ncbi:DNA repair protein rad18 [Corynespora cassiicola Philippines]|uniref:Postreplication repair E3 ubiquitin-protein ligase RAD18 n=1 Tax=Corynespora cassiicola Philippines TaxID=1448308 RepID=A0A2T2N9L1_CORCC|nr:DNA repair protein rad18 [Corynespora cassiicola Philippines]
MPTPFEVTDSTDWLSTSLPLFEPLEAALRCEVCKEFYENPVVTTCHHTFCSLCIRRSIGDSNAKCPSCRASVQADKLAPNHAVREIVGRFREARAQAMGVARVEERVRRGGKRKGGEAGIGEPEGRVTRARVERARVGGKKQQREVVEVEDSEDEYVEDEEEEEVGSQEPPPGMAACPMCFQHMKPELVWDHINNCQPGAPKSSPRNTRSSSNVVIPSSNPRPARQRESPPPSRLPGINYATCNETTLRKKLKALGINSTGSKELMIRRHREWLNIYNANCDAGKNRKSNKELLKELAQWENTLGGNAKVVESKIMKSDFDMRGHASTHKSQFEELIANARRKKPTPKAADPAEDKDETNTDKMDGIERTTTTEQALDPHAESEPAIHPGALKPVDPARPYQGNESALASIRAKVQQAKLSDSKSPSLGHEPSGVTNGNDHSTSNSGPTIPSEVPGIQNPFGSPTRKVSMFALPEQPVMDVENSSNSQ